MSQSVALIAGVTGTIGAALARHLCSLSNWTVVGVSRRPPVERIAGVRYLQTDLAVPAACNEAIATVAGISHLFYCGRASHNEQLLEDAPANLALLRNVLNAVEAASSVLQHVHLVQGGKYYGVHIGPFPTPAREHDARAPIANFNYDQQDFLQARSTAADWQWTASRPNTLLHFSPGNPRNLVSTLGAYAAICRELGAALDFPGVAGAFDSLSQVTTLPVLARAIQWMACEPACAGQAFNITNTDTFRWRSLWPQLAQAFDMPPGGVRPMPLSQQLAARAALWQQIARRHRLAVSELGGVANWDYADATLERYWDEILCHNKTRAHGFHEWDNSEQAFFRILQQYREAGILPG